MNYRIPHRDRAKRIRSTATQANDLSRQIADLKTQLAATTDTNQRHTLRHRIRSLQRAWLAKARAIAEVKYET